MEAFIEAKNGTATINWLGQSVTLTFTQPPTAEDIIADAIEKSLSENVFTSEHVWLGASHNAWKDRLDEIFPLALITQDIERQTAEIKSGITDQYGLGLWVDHMPVVAGDCKIRVVLPGGRTCFEAGNLNPAFLDLKATTMSVGALAKKSVKTNEYLDLFIYERSALVDTTAINARTFFRIKPRQVKDSLIAGIAEELAQ